jgi:hypothetical protein
LTIRIALTLVSLSLLGELGEVNGVFTGSRHLTTQTNDVISIVTTDVAEDPSSPLKPRSNEPRLTVIGDLWYHKPRREAQVCP